MAELPEAQAPKRARTLKQQKSESLNIDQQAAAFSRVLDAEGLVDGTLLPQLARENLAGFAQVLQQESAPRPDKVTLTWASACSGTEGAFYVAMAINAALGRARAKTSLQHVFSCEANKDKQRWISAVLSAGKASWAGLDDFVARCGLL